MATLATGYGPSRRLLFDGDEAKYELWEIKLLGYMRLHKLYGVIVAENEPEEDNVSKNIDAFAQLIQCLDDRSLPLVMRDARDDGRKALQILRNHYMGKSTPCTPNLPRYRRGTMSLLRIMFYVPRPQLHR